jgi:hypothetical protein
LGEVVVVLALAAVAGVAAYSISLRISGDEVVGEPTGQGFVGGDDRPLDDASSDLPAGYQYAVLAPGRRSWQTRVLAFVGILFLVAVGATVLAIAIYEIGHLIRITLDGYVGGSSSGSPTPSP